MKILENLTRAKLVENSGRCRKWYQRHKTTRCSHKRAVRLVSASEQWILPTNVWNSKFHRIKSERISEIFCVKSMNGHQIFSILRKVLTNARRELVLGSIYGWSEPTFMRGMKYQTPKSSKKYGLLIIRLRSGEASQSTKWYLETTVELVCRWTAGALRRHQNHHNWGFRVRLSLVFSRWLQRTMLENKINSTSFEICHWRLHFAQNIQEGYSTIWFKTASWDQISGSTNENNIMNRPEIKLPKTGHEYISWINLNNEKIKISLQLRFV